MIYLDHNGTTPLSAAAKTAMASAFEIVGNASSVHRHGRVVRGAIERARTTVAATVGALPRELVFTSGGTEALHLAVRGVGAANKVGSILLDPGAHPALQAACERLAKSAGILLDFISPDPYGRSSLESLEELLTNAPKPALVAVSWVQHETGAIAALPAIVKLCAAHEALLVVDAVQALGKIPVDLAATGIAAAAISAHKIGGPSGIGAAWIRHDVRAHSVLDGGAQERGMRAGTENLIGISGFAGAIETVHDRLQKQGVNAQLRQQFETSLSTLTNYNITPTLASARVASVLHGSVLDVPGEEVVAALDLDGLSISSGPACSSGRPGPSAAMLRMFPNEKWRATGALRISLGYETSQTEATQAVQILTDVLQRFARLRSGKR